MSETRAHETRTEGGSGRPESDRGHKSCGGNGLEEPEGESATRRGMERGDLATARARKSTQGKGGSIRSQISLS